MKRSVILSLCAVALAAIGMSTAQATVNVALNLRYNDPFDTTEGGTWTLVAQSDDPNSNGITGLVVRFTDIAAAGTVNASIGHDINDPNNELVIGTFGLETEFVYGQDPNDGLVANVGLAAGPSNVASDPLNNTAWDNASEIATGAFTTRPVFVAGSVGANVDISGTIVAATIGLTNVRGDSVSIDGLQAGDANRSGNVDFLDFSALSSNFNVTGVPPNEPLWDSGNFNDDTIVDFLDFSSLSGTFGTSGTPPAIGAVPEPASLILFAGFGIAGFLVRRRS